MHGSYSSNLIAAISLPPYTALLKRMVSFNSKPTQSGISPQSSFADSLGI